MKFLRKVLGIILLLIAFYLFLIAIYGLLDNDVNISTKIIVEVMISVVMVPLFILSFKLLKPSNDKKNKVLLKETEKLNLGMLNSEKAVVNTYVIEFPFYGVRTFIDADGLEAFKYYDGNEAFKWFDDSVISGISNAWDYNNIISFVDNVDVKNKIDSMKLIITETGKGNIFVKVYVDLTKEEKEYLIQYISGQLSDGFGEGDFDFVDADGLDYSVEFWKYHDDWYIKYLD